MAKQIPNTLEFDENELDDDLGLLDDLNPDYNMEDDGIENTEFDDNEISEFDDEEEAPEVKPKGKKKPEKTKPGKQEKTKVKPEDTESLNRPLVKTDMGVVELAREIGTTPQKLRAFLRRDGLFRDVNSEAKGTKYSWTRGSKEVQEILDAWASGGSSTRKKKEEKTQDENKKTKKEKPQKVDPDEDMIDLDDIDLDDDDLDI